MSHGWRQHSVLPEPVPVESALSGLRDGPTDAFLIAIEASDCVGYSLAQMGMQQSFGD